MSKITLTKIKKKIFVIFELINKKYLHGHKPTNIIFVEPDYYVIDNLNEQSVVVDIGTGNDANFSLDLIKKFSLKSYGFDPTKKHYQSLKIIENEHDGKFRFFNYALSDKAGEAEFNESAENVSGSFFSDHINVKNNRINKYTVKTVSIKDIFSELAVPKINVLKIDVEGEEYRVIDSLTKNLTDNIDQFALEFHHHCIDKYSIFDTLRALKKMECLGYKFYSADGINYLFYKKHD